jgi:hypothetical protein
MAFIYEVNGQRVEFEKEPTQADIDEAAASMAPAAPAAPAASSTVGAVAEAASIPVTAYGYGAPTGIAELGQAAKAAVGPYAESVGQGLKNTVDVYKARPMLAPAVDALGLATVGIPPIAAGQQALSAYDKYQAVKQGLTGAGQELGKGQATKDAYNAMQRALYQNDPTGFRKTISSTYGPPTNAGVPAGPGNNAVRSLLKTPAAEAAMAANPQFAQAAAEYLKTVPTYGEQAMKVAGPALRGAARVIGPVGNAMLAYDMVNQFAENKKQIEANPNAQGLQYNPYAQQLRGEAPSQAAAGAMNQRTAIRNMPYGAVTAEERAILDKDRLNMAVRVQAAKRILGQQQ